LSRVAKASAAAETANGRIIIGASVILMPFGSKIFDPGLL